LVVESGTDQQKAPHAVPFVCWSKFHLLAGTDAGRLYVTELPSQQNADEQQNRNAYPQGQRECHFLLPGFSVGIFFQHENESSSQTAEDGDKCKNYPIFHGLDYLVKARWKFWLITLGAVLAIACTLALGRWQLSRAAQKLVLQGSVDSRANLPMLNGQALASLADPVSALHRKVTLRGRWMPEHTVYLDNRQMNDKQGLYVVTPLRLEGSSAVILVQRGWVARNFVDRAILPQIETPVGVVEIQGRIAPPPVKLYQFGAAETGLIRQNIDMLSFSAELSAPLLAVTVQQTAVASEGLLRDWPRVASGVEKHYGYAFQWFALAALIAILYVWFQIVRRFIRPPQ
jgi:surfeit locus 1 family protein